MHHCARTAGHPLKDNYRSKFKRIRLGQDSQQTDMKLSCNAEFVEKVEFCFLETFNNFCVSIRKQLELVAIVVLGNLINTTRGSQFLLIISKSFMSRIRTAPLKIISIFKAVKTFIHAWVINYSAPKKLLATNGKRFTATFFQEVHCIFNIHNVFIWPSIHRQMNRSITFIKLSKWKSAITLTTAHPTEINIRYL